MRVTAAGERLGERGPFTFGASLRTLLALLAAAAALGTIAVALRALDSESLLATLERSPLLWLALLPPLLGTILDAQGLRRLVPSLGFGSAVRLRVSSDALVLTVPSGSILSEALAFLLVKRGKELVWALIGFGVLAAGRRRRGGVGGPALADASLGAASA